MSLCFIDVETTGINVFRDNPIQIGLLLVNESLDVEKEFMSDIQPLTNNRFSAASQKIHGRNSFEFDTAPTAKEVLKELFAQLGTEYCFVGWNISFDIPFFRKLCYKSGYMRDYNAIDYRHIDVQSLNFAARKIGIIPNQNESLSSLCKYFKLDRSVNHNALEDCHLTLQVYKALMNRFKNK